jgi:RHS repeat-associated protein
MIQNNTEDRNVQEKKSVSAPPISLPNGGGAIKGIEEKFQVNAANGTSSFEIPIPLSPSRQGFTPAVGISYSSGSGNSAFGLGWDVGIPSISRKTEKKLPLYDDENDSDTFTLTGVEDLVPLMEKQGDQWSKLTEPRTENTIAYSVTRYRPRIEGAFDRIEKWKNIDDGSSHWRTVSSDNIHAYYGLTPESRIYDPQDGGKVFEWLLCRTHDDKGNITLFRYKKEDFADIPPLLNEKNRINHCTQLYIKKILYGNKTPYFQGDAVPTENDFLFNVQFDYGEHDAAPDIPQDIHQEKNNWQCRKDPFSNYRPGFEIRTYRRCNRIMVFHRFDAPHLPHNPFLVKSLELTYDDELDLIGNGGTVEGFSYLVRARQNGHNWDDAANHYTTKHLPDLEFSYRQHEWNTAVENVSPANTVHAPVGIDHTQYLWVDLFSEGLPGILTEQTDGWYYKSNQGGGDFSHARPVAPVPSFRGLSPGVTSVQELQGNGIKSLVKYEGEPKGFFKLTPEEEWEPFRSFDSVPNISTFDPAARLIDLSGDGLADLLVPGENTMRWYPGAGEKGFEVSKTVAKAVDEEKGPAVLFEDREQSIFLADMSGDGLTDIVRIRNGETCYWPNLGYGRFGAKVNMDHAPRFDNPDSFNPQYLRLADIDGSGTIDIVYLGKNDFRVWMNLNGNAWTTEPQIIPAFPGIDSLADVSVLDFLGTGTAGIVYSSPLPQHARLPLQYIDLMGSKKPHLLYAYHNNCGGEVSIEYKSSTHFYLEDKKEGREWITKLPFPVHCIAKVRAEDKIRETVFTTSYRYSHGYYDSHEREFRGFARVEQLDTEDFSRFKLNGAKNVVEEELHQPPMRTVTWFHTGAFLQNEKILHQCAAEYFNNEHFDEYTLPEPFITEALPAYELREALRACKGLTLRSEVYADDNTPRAGLPYSASQATFEIRRVQPKQDNEHAVFMIIPSESVSYSYERNPADPRISHSFVIEADPLGNPTKTASVVYPRVSRPAAPDEIPDNVWEEQDRLHITYNETRYTEDIIEDDVYRLREAWESKTFEISGISPAAGTFFGRQEITGKINGINDIKGDGLLTFEQEFSGGPQKRLSGHGKTYYLKDDLSEPLPPGKLSRLGIKHNSYQLAFTKDLVPKYYGAKVTDQMLEAAGYVHREIIDYDAAPDGAPPVLDEDWWTYGATAIFAANPWDNFYTPVGTRDEFGNESFVEYDGFVLLAVSATDAAGNTISAVNDYRTLSPVMVVDPNLNRSAVETDELGMVVKSAVMGKEGAGEGDTLADPTTRMEYDLFNWQNNQKPNVVHTFVREMHGPANPRWQESYAYSDGGGSVIMTKAQAEPGIAKRWNPVSKQVEEIDADPRWVGGGRTIINNKGNPVKQYEPYFSETHQYESEDTLVETGVTSIIYYDPPGRAIRTEKPDGTFTRTAFDGWHSKSYDVNDTVKESRWYIERGSPDPDLIVEPSDPEQRAAWLAAKHYDTPGISYTDSLGRAFYTTTVYGNGKTTSVFSEKDPVGRYARMYDQLGRMVSETYTNLLGKTIYAKSAEKGERWIFSDVMGRPVKTWVNDIRELRGTFDRLHRPVSRFVKENGVEILFSHVVYGDILPDAAQRNMIGKAYQQYDQDGVLTKKTVDFKGNVVEVERTLAKEYKQSVNWQPLEGLTSVTDIENAAAPLLENEIFSSSSVLDALGRPVQVTLPDQSIVETSYNEANSLDSLRVKIRGQGNFITFLENQDYDAKGQRQYAQYGNGLITNYFYDPRTFRLENLVTKRTGTPDTQSLQDLHYTYDPVGNIVYSRDDAQQTHYYDNAVVKAESRFEYDAAYRLLKASGREHAGQGGNTQRDHQGLPYIASLPHANDTNAVRHYTEQYDYDDCGNILEYRHIASGADWTRRYRYEYQDDAANNTNRLKSTSLPGDADTGPYSATYQHDPHGNMTQMPHLAQLTWDFKDRLSEVDLGGGGKAYYVYGVGGSRTRKVIEKIGGKKLERIFLGTVEIYREYQAGVKKLERSTLHVSDNTGRIAQVDTKLLDTDNADTANPVNQDLIRYQYGNHLGSAVMETDETGTVISYEEYHSYGSSAYRSSKSGVDLSLKRYRFSGKERDDETGMYYFGARYYAAWLGRWSSSDPAGFADGLNLYSYALNNPIVFTDPNGTQTCTAEDLPCHPGIDPSLSPPKAKPKSSLKLPSLPTSLPTSLDELRVPGTFDAPLNRAPGDPFPLKIFPHPETQPKAEAAGSTSEPPSSTTPSVPPNPEPNPASSNDQNVPESNQIPTNLSSEARAIGLLLTYLAVEGIVADSVRIADNAKKAQIGNNAATIIKHLHKSFQNHDTLQRIARAAFNARNSARAASQAKMLPLGRLISWLMDKSRDPSRTFGAILQKRITKAGGNLSEGYKKLATGAAKGRKIATTTARGAGIGGRLLGGIGIIFSSYALYEDIRTENYDIIPTDVASIGTGGLVLAGAPLIPVTLASIGVTAANVGGDYVGEYVEEETDSREAGVAAGTLTGVAAGAATGAIIGSIVPGIGTAVGAGVGAVAGGVSGFVGAYW